MFQFNKKLKRLDIPAKDVLRLHRSLSDVQIALPGIPAQRAMAYVCAFSTEHGLRVAIAFQLRDSHDIVYYLNGGGNILKKEIRTVLNEGIHFAETLGFILSDLDIHQADPVEKKTIWDSLPLKHLPKSVTPEKPLSGHKPAAVQKGGNESLPADAVQVEEIVELDDSNYTQKDSVEDIDLGLPRSTALVSMRRKKLPPTAEELEEKKKILRERLGRFLSSM
jgi:hypothetical protein